MRLRLSLNDVTLSRNKLVRFLSVRFFLCVAENALGYVPPSIYR
jgi:hypothetical protein